MSTFWRNIDAFFYSLWNQFVGILTLVRPQDILDIAIVAFIIYKGIELIRETRAQQLFKGLVILLGIFLVARWLDLKSLTWLMVKVFDYAIIAFAIVFQPEIRRALERMGRSNFSAIGLSQSVEEEREIWLRCIDAVSKASQTMQERKVGALMVFERTTLLGEIINTGTVVDAAASASLICNVFYPKSPLHDGAMIIRGGRVHAAGCILPLTPNTDLSRELGTRHRAAIGMSENSDAVVVVVSEETGNISIAVNGVLTRDYNPIILREQLKKYILSDEGEDTPKRFRRVRGIFKFIGGKRENGQKKD